MEQDKIDHILLVGFGGPEKSEDIMPFLKRVTAGKNIPEQRLQGVRLHYELVGGFSFYNAWAFRLKGLLREALGARGVEIPLFVGFRNWKPFFEDSLAEIDSEKLSQGVALILAPYRSETSCKKYKDNVEAAKEEKGLTHFHYEYVNSWYDRPDFIEVQAELVKESLEKVKDRNQLEVLFSCHSIPTSMLEACSSCHYQKEYEDSCKWVAESAGISNYQITYQSRSGRPTDSWLEPDICDVIEKIDSTKKEVLVIPMGFLCDNVEVLYDLDFEAKEACEKKGIQYYRADTVTHHPKFIAMLAAVIQEKILENG